jgi:hypothetical protein
MVERLPSPGVSATQPVRPAQPLERTGDPRLDALQRTLATMLGSKVPVSVLSRLGDGSFVVRVADMAVRMQLPPGTQPGAELSMKVLAASPQPTFQLGDATLHAAPAPSGANASSAASLAAAVAAATTSLHHVGGQDAAADLSPAARLLAQVLHSAAGEGASARTANAAAVTSPTPLLPQGVPDPAQLAGRLAQAIAKSGLFYESHLAEWAEGKRSLNELAQEPQARNAPGTAATDPASARMINLQLASHEQAQVLWQGQLAPGQPFEWRVAREQDGQARGEDEPEPGWESGLRLRFAALGEVEASVSLRGSRLRIALHAATDAAAALRAGASPLQEALAAAGAELAALHIGAREDA